MMKGPIITWITQANAARKAVPAWKAVALVSITLYASTALAWPFKKEEQPAPEPEPETEDFGIIEFDEKASATESTAEDLSYGEVLYKYGIEKPYNALARVTASAFSWPFKGKKVETTPFEHSVQDLYYGEALYNYYLDKPLSALTHLEIAKIRNNTTEIDLNYPYPEIFNTSLSLNYGFTKKAAKQLAVLAETELPTEAKAQMNFLLAKQAYYRGLYEESLAAINELPEESTAAYMEEAYYFKAQIALGQNDLETAKSVLPFLSESSPWRPYLLYNIAYYTSTNDTSTNDTAEPEILEETANFEAIEPDQNQLEENEDELDLSQINLDQLNNINQLNNIDQLNLGEVGSQDTDNSESADEQNNAETIAETESENDADTENESEKEAEASSKKAEDPNKWHNLTQEALENKRYENGILNTEYAALYDRSVISQALFQFSQAIPKQKRMGQQLASIGLDSPWLASGLFANALVLSDTDPDKAHKAWHALLNLPGDSYEKDAAGLLILKSSPLLSSPLTEETYEQKVSADDEQALRNRKNTQRAATLLSAYEQAITHFSSKISGLDALLSEEAFDPWFRSWTQEFITKGNSKLPSDDTAWILWLSNQEVQSLVSNLTEMRKLEEHINHWKKTLPFLSLIIRTREAGLQKRLSKVPIPKLLSIYEKQRSAYNRLRPILNSLDNTRTPWVLGDEDTLYYRDVIRENEKRVERLYRANLISQEEKTTAERALKRSKGLLIWDLEISRPERMWENRKNLLLIEQALKESEARLQGFQTDLIENKPFETAINLVEAMTRRIETLAPMLAAADNTLYEQLATSLKQALQIQAERSKTYLSFATYEYARIYDQYWQSQLVESSQAQQEQDLEPNQ